ncbi:MAG: acyltransferase [Panacagrimonas sp.]|jgi:1-acyl-sn-glycerol-3-phosphate acyltransferase|nr:acyltransferase [Panacagrimonas sp.]MCC2655710.1 acyltransferase [Panacagrimonas sp.]
MLHALPGPVQGAIMGLLLAVNTVFWATPLYVVVLIKLITPWRGGRETLSRLAAAIAQTWSHFNVFFSSTCQRIEWDVRIGVDLDRKGQYLVCSNHQTWNDIFVLMRAFDRRAPFFKFFLKQELIWVPVLGLAWWGLDYPFMKRSTPDQIKKNPALKGKDLETTRRACEKFRNQPVMILNFLEGTRFTKTKQVNQKAPYHHLLRPKAGGFAFALEAMGDKLHDLVDVTIAYPDGAMGFWDFLCGKMTRVIVDVRRLQLPDGMLDALVRGDYEESNDFRKQFQFWIGDLWKQKDQRIAQMLGLPPPVYAAPVA